MEVIWYFPLWMKLALSGWPLKLLLTFVGGGGVQPVTDSAKDEDKQTKLANSYSTVGKPVVV